MMISMKKWIQETQVMIFGQEEEEDSDELRKEGLLLREEDREKLRIHRMRTRKIVGCVECGKEILPPFGVSSSSSSSTPFSFNCGQCEEMHSYCLSCESEVLRKDTSNKHSLEYQPSSSSSSRHKLYLEPVILEVDPSELSSVSNISEVFSLCFKIYSSRPCLGLRKLTKPPSLPPRTRTRTTEGGKRTTNGEEKEEGKQKLLVDEDFEDEYSWLSYKDVEERIATLGRAFSALSSSSSSSSPSSSAATVLLFGSSSIEWYLTQFACFIFGYVVVPLHPSLSSENLRHILQICKPIALFASKHLELIVRQALISSPTSASSASPLLSSIVWIDDLPDPYLSVINSSSSSSSDFSLLSPSLILSPTLFPRVYQFNELFLRTSLSPSSPSCSSFPPSRPTGKNPDRIVMLLPTSGTSGRSKLTIITDLMLLNQAKPPRMGVLLGKSSSSLASPTYSLFFLHDFSSSSLFSCSSF
jgi:hypothetical protein